MFVHPARPDREGQGSTQECACCCHEVPGLVPCPRGHYVCSACQARAARIVCLFCQPLPDPEEAVEASRPPEEPVSPPREELSQCMTMLLRGLVCFFVLVYAGKAYAVVFMAVQDKPCAWCSWRSLRHCGAEFLIGLVGSALLLGLSRRGGDILSRDSR